MPDDALTRKGAAIYIGNEDDFATVVKGRLLLAGADMRDVIVLDPNRTGDLTFPEDVDKLRHRVEDHGVVLVVIDPWTAFMSPKLSNYNDQEFRRAIGPAQLLAQQLGVAVILMRHLKKGTAPARERGLGTVGMGNAARSVMLFKTDPDDVTGAVIVQHKQNLGDRSRPLRYKITSDDPHDPSRARVEWRGTSAHTVADLIAVADEDDEHRTQTDECAQWLHVLLWENDPHQAERKDVLAKMHDDKFTWSEKVLRSARRRLGVITTRQAKERPGTTWRLPVDAQPPAEGNAKDGSRDQQSGPSHKQPKGTTEGRTVPAQQTPGLQAPAESSQALPIDIGRYRARQATKTCQQDGCNKAGRRYKYGTFCNNHKAEHRDN